MNSVWYVYRILNVIKSKRKEDEPLKKFLILVVSVVMLCLPATLMADQTLTFEGFADNTVLTTQYPGINFQGAQILQKSTGSLNWTQFPPHSGDAVIYNPSGPMELIFSTPIDYFSGYLTYNSGMTLNGYDSLNNLLDTESGAYANNYVSSGNPPNEYLIINAANITRVELIGGGGNNFTLDDAQFTGSIDTNQVPEPTTMLLLGSGLIGLAGYGRKKFFKK